MILLAAVFVAGDSWTWNVAIRYDDRDGPLLNDRERWTLRVGKNAELTAERAFLGTMVDETTLIPPSDPQTEILKGKVEADGTLTLKGDWSDLTVSKAVRRFLKGDKKDEFLPSWPVARRATWLVKDVCPPGSDSLATLRVDVTLTAARLGGREIVTANPGTKPF